MSKRYNLVFEANATFQHTVNWKDPSGAPIDMTGFRVRLQVRQNPGSTAKLVDFDSDAPPAGTSITPLDDSGSFTTTVRSGIGVCAVGLIAQEDSVGVLMC